MGRVSSVGIATRHGLDGPVIESRCVRDFPHPSRPTLGPTQHPVTMGTGSFPGVKRPERGADHPPPSKCQGHERVGLYLYSPSGPSWSVIGRTLPLLKMVVGQHHAPAALPPGKTRYPLNRRLGGSKGRSGRVRKISPTPTGIRSPDSPARSESLYRLSYRGRYIERLYISVTQLN